MQILLKDLLKEDETTATTTNSPLRVQIYCDMDGVLVDMEKGFRALSGGLNPKDYEMKYGKGSFWKVIGRKKDYWITLDPMPDAMVLWKFLTESFKDPVPVILSAGQGSTVVQQKTEWIHKHLGTGIKVMIAPAGTKKPEFVLPSPDLGAGKYVTHVLVDDTQKNLNAWNNDAAHRIAIHHTSAAESIKALDPFITK
jgi:hypothetical protein